MAEKNFEPIFKICRQILHNYVWIEPKDDIVTLDERYYTTKTKITDKRYLFYSLYKTPKKEYHNMTHFMYIALGWGKLINKDKNHWKNMYTFSYRNMYPYRDFREVIFINKHIDVQINTHSFHLEYKWGNIKKSFYVSNRGRVIEIPKNIYDIFQIVLYEILVETV